MPEWVASAWFLKFSEGILHVFGCSPLCSLALNPEIVAVLNPELLGFLLAYYGLCKTCTFMI